MAFKRRETKLTAAKDLCLPLNEKYDGVSFGIIGLWGKVSGIDVLPVDPSGPIAFTGARRPQETKSHEPESERFHRRTQVLNI